MEKVGKDVVRLNFEIKNVVDFYKWKRTCSKIHGLFEKKVAAFFMSLNYKCKKK